MNDHPTRPGPMTCPSRMNQPGPWERVEGLDHWENNRWLDDHDKAEALRKEWRDNNPPGSCSEVMNEWVWPTPVPRTCSFCGGVHPDDALMLISNGWEVEPTSKGHKRYLAPPGSQLAHQRLIEAIENRQELSDLPEHHKPVPPVKLYTWHFTQDQAKRFNEVLKERAKREADTEAN